MNFILVVDSRGKLAIVNTAEIIEIEYEEGGIRIYMNHHSILCHSTVTIESLIKALGGTYTVNRTEAANLILENKV
jgi:hypothetical protein